MNPPTIPGDDRIVLAHGGGGELMGRLIRDRILPVLGNETLSRLDDGAVLAGIPGKMVVTTDSYVVDPLEFPGGDIGRLAVAGTVNDLSMMGAMPVALTLAFIIEEGLTFDVLDRILQSIAATARQAGVRIVAGDTKVVERGSGSGLFINTSGIGRQRDDVRLDDSRIVTGDAIIVSGTIADHGLAVLSKRNGLEFESALQSDVAPLNRMVADVLDTGADVKFMRDATRGGLAGVLCDICQSTGRSIEIEETHLPITPTARHAAEMLGLDPLTVANEGKAVFVVRQQDLGKVSTALRNNPLGRDAAAIGHVTEERDACVELLTTVGGRRIVQRPYGEDLPRIC